MTFKPWKKLAMLKGKPASKKKKIPPLCKLSSVFFIKNTSIPENIYGSVRIKFKRFGRVACSMFEKYTGEFTERRNFFLFRCWFAFKHSELFPGLESHFRFLDISGLNLDNKAEFYEAASSAYEIIKRSGQIPYHQ